MCMGIHLSLEIASSSVCMNHNAFAACSIWRHPCKDEDGAQPQQKWRLRQREAGSSSLRRAEEERAAAVICLTSHAGICRGHRQDGGVASKPLFLQLLGFACICPGHNWTKAVRCRLLQMGNLPKVVAACISLFACCCYTCTVAGGRGVNVNSESTLILAWCCSPTQRSQ